MFKGTLAQIIDTVNQPPEIVIWLLVATNLMGLVKQWMIDRALKTEREQTRKDRELDLKEKETIARILREDKDAAQIARKTLMDRTEETQMLILENTAVNEQQIKTSNGFNEKLERLYRQHGKEIPQEVTIRSTPENPVHVARPEKQAD